eukprot:2672048-Lingulodinium_polyedra.AAC.1
MREPATPPREHANNTRTGHSTSMQTQRICANTAFGQTQASIQTQHMGRESAKTPFGGTRCPSGALKLIRSRQRCTLLRCVSRTQECSTNTGGTTPPNFMSTQTHVNTALLFSILRPTDTTPRAV